MSNTLPPPYAQLSPLTETQPIPIVDSMYTENNTVTSRTFRKELGDGLVLRWSTPDDTERIAQLAALAFRDKADEPPNEDLRDLVRSFLHGRCPFLTPYDFGIIEDTSKEGRPVVACACHWQHEWEYEGLRFPVGRPEIVASDPQYRHRGLIRELFALLHARSEAEGRPVQAITGIPYFYRQFGYEYALELGGSRIVSLSSIPALKEGEQELCTLRHATVEDIPFLQQCYNQRQADSMVWHTLSDDFWRCYIEAWDDEPGASRPVNVHQNVQVIIDTQGQQLGFLFASARRWGGDKFMIWDMDITPGINAQRLMPSLLRAIKTLAEQAIVTRADIAPLQGITFNLGGSHPLYDILGKQFTATSEKPYAWYIRVPDLPAFLRLLAPVLERRLASSLIAGYSGEVRLSFYRDGLRLVFQEGKLTQTEAWRAPAYDANISASFPPLVFLQLLFGHRSIEELGHIFPDVSVSSEADVVLRTLFPTRPSFVYG